MNVSEEPTRLPPLLSGHRLLDIATVGMALPLFASYWIKHASLPRAVFPLLYSWGLASVVVLPFLALAEIGAIYFARRSPTTARVHVLAASIALFAVAIFLIAREL